MATLAGSIEEDVKRLQSRQLGARERLATRLVLAEKVLLQRTMDAVRRRLAPIRGVPTKKGMVDPNSVCAFSVALCLCTRFGAAS